jgi:hypothetical protein
MKFNSRHLIFYITFIIFFACQFTFAQQSDSDSSAVADADTITSIGPDTLVTPSFIKLDTLSYRFIGDGNFTRGNVNRSLVVLRAEIILTGPVISIATNPRFTYGKQNGILAERDSYMDLFVDVFKKKRTYVFGLGNLETSNLRGITLRVVGGAGIGFRVVRTSKNTLLLTNAIIHESTNFRERPTISIQRNSFRVKGKHSFAKDRFRNGLPCEPVMKILMRVLLKQAGSVMIPVLLSVFLSGTDNKNNV